MQKIKKVISSIMGACALGLLFAGSVMAFAPEIMTLPSYVTTNNFKLSCTASGSSAQFIYRKEGGSWTNLGSAVDLTTSQCQVQATSTQINEQTRYYFKVNVDGTDSAETTTFYDISGPSGASNYYKEQVGTGFYKLHWKNPSDSDFSKVIIYRGETADFPADASHQIAQVSGGAGSDMTYDEHQPDANKTYYYAIRALDAAGNSSSLVGDAGVTYTTTTTTQGAAGGTGGQVTTLPSDGQGSVLGEEVTPTPEPEAAATEAASALEQTGILKWILTHKKISLGVVLGLFILWSLVRSRQKHS